MQEDTSHLQCRYASTPPTGLEHGDSTIDRAKHGGSHSNSNRGVLVAPLRRFVSRFRVDRGPLRWWLIVVGMLLVQYSAWRFALGTVFVATGALLHLLSKCYLRQSRAFLRRTGALTTRGPYRFTRNPFYLANLLAEGGLLVIIGRWQIAVAYLIVWSWVYLRTIRSEETKLAQLCGETFARYCKRVPRLFPLPWKYLAGRDASGPCFSWRNPNIAGGKELERSLRLLSYPLLLHVAASIHEMRHWSLSELTNSTLLCAAGFVLINSLGWCSTRWMNRLKEPMREANAVAAVADASGAGNVNYERNGKRPKCLHPDCHGGLTTRLASP